MRIPKFLKVTMTLFPLKCALKNLDKIIYFLNKLINFFIIFYNNAKFHKYIFIFISVTRKIYFGIIIFLILPAKKGHSQVVFFSPIFYSCKMAYLLLYEMKLIFEILRALVAPFDYRIFGLGGKIIFID